MKNLLTDMTDKYKEDLNIRLSHHSTAIEGNKISLTNAKTIILKGRIPNPSIDIRDFHELNNHVHATNYVFEKIANNEKLDINIVKEINEILLFKLDYNAGNFKVHDNEIKGANFLTAPAQQTPLLMDQWQKNLEYRLENSKTDEEKIKAIIEAHINFERIHPFADGNGRTGRLVMLYSLLQENLVPFVITVKKRNKYMKYLNEQNIDDFYNLSQELANLERSKLEK